MKMERKTEKVTVSLPPEVIRLADQNWEKFGFKNRSELIDAAIREYISRDLLKEFTGELSQFYQKIERSEIKHLEEHLAKLSYKIAVEIAQMHLWEGRYSPKVNGKRMTRNVYAKTEAECEVKLAELIREMKAESAVLPAPSKAG